MSDLITPHQHCQPDYRIGLLYPQPDYRIGPLHPDRCAKAPKLTT